MSLINIIDKHLDALHNFSKNNPTTAIPAEIMVLNMGLIRDLADADRKLDLVPRLNSDPQDGPQEPATATQVEVLPAPQVERGVSPLRLIDGEFSSELDEMTEEDFLAMAGGILRLLLPLVDRKSDNAALAENLERAIRSIPQLGERQEALTHLVGFTAAGYKRPPLNTLLQHPGAVDAALDVESKSDLPPKPRRTRKFTEAQKQQARERMRKYWAEGRMNKKKAS
jgi:hypothetical protein